MSSLQAITKSFGANVLVAIFSEQESQAVYFLKKADINRLDVVNYISHGVRKDAPIRMTRIQVMMRVKVRA